MPDGVIVVDLGWDSDLAWQTFTEGLSRAGVRLDEIIGVVATHAHPDHYGLAGRIHAATSAWVAVHEAELLQLAPQGNRDDRVRDLTLWLQRCGVPDNHDGMRREVNRLVGAMAATSPDFVLTDQATVPGTDGALIAIHTPGHSAGHLCFHDRNRRLLFSGDHLLPKTRTNVAKRPGNPGDPLGEFTASLDRLDGLVNPETLILPGHEWPFDRSAERITALAERNLRRLEEVRAAVGDGAETVWEVAQHLVWSRPFDDFDSHAQRQVLGETYGQLFRLAQDRRLVMHCATQDDGPVRWELPS